MASLRALVLMENYGADLELRKYFIRMSRSRTQTTYKPKTQSGGRDEEEEPLVSFNFLPWMRTLMRGVVAIALVLDQNYNDRQ